MLEVVAPVLHEYVTALPPALRVTDPLPQTVVEVGKVITGALVTETLVTVDAVPQLLLAVTV